MGGQISRSCPASARANGAAGIRVAGVKPAGITPAAVEPSGIDAAGNRTAAVWEPGITAASIKPAGITPAGIEPAGLTPAAVEPSGINPAGVEPAAVEPSGIDAASNRTAAVREPGIAAASVKAAGIKAASALAAAIVLLSVATALTPLGVRAADRTEHPVTVSQVPGADWQAAAADARTVVTLTLFHGRDCTHCADERPFLVGLESKYPGLVVDQYEVWYDGENREMLKRTAAEMGFVATGTPVTILGDKHWVGFDETTARAIEAAIAAEMAGTEVDEDAGAFVEVPILGAIDVTHSSLVLSAVVIGFVDGVNPCSLWVLSVLLAIVLHSGSRGRVAFVGITFLTVTTSMYAFYMAGMYSALDYIGKLAWIRLVVACVALTFGLIHMKEYFWFKQGPSLTIDDARKPGLYKRMRNIARSDRSLPAVLGGTVVLAAGVSLLETPCTAGLPLLWTSMLASQGVALPVAVGLFAIYMFVFLMDELAVFFLAIATLRMSKLDEQQGRMLKLLSGSVMVTLAVAMFAVPSALESVSGTVKVFGSAVLMMATIIALGRVVTAVKARRSA